MLIRANVTQTTRNFYANFSLLPPQLVRIVRNKFYGLGEAGNGNWWLVPPVDLLGASVVSGHHFDLMLCWRQTTNYKLR